MTKKKDRITFAGSHQPALKAMTDKRLISSLRRQYDKALRKSKLAMQIAVKRDPKTAKEIDAVIEEIATRLNEPKVVIQGFLSGEYGI